MSDINKAPTQIAEPKKYKTKFCFAVIPVAIMMIIYSIAIISYIVMIFSNISVSTYILSIANVLTDIIFWIIFSIALLLKRPNNLLIPISLGGALIIPTIINIIGYSILSKAEGWEYTITPWTVFGLIISFTAVAVCVLFTLKAPALKSFMKKTGIIWAISIPLLKISECFFVVVNSIKNYNLYGNSDSFAEYFLTYELPGFLANLLTYILHASALFLLFRWLANPYKEVTAVQPKPIPAPQYAQPVAVPVQPQPRVPVQVAPQSVYQPTIADEIAKYKNLFDSGAITQEEFDALKAKIINKQA